MTHVLLDSRRRSLVACAALSLPLSALACTVLDENYYPELIEAPAQAPSAESASPPELETTLEPTRAAAPEARDAQARDAADEGRSPDSSDETEAARAEEPGVIALLPEALEPAPAPPELGTEPSELDPPVAVDVLDTADGACPNGFGEFGAPERVVIEGMDAELRGPSITSNGSILYFSAASGGSISIYEAARTAAGSAVFGSVAPVSELETAGRNGTPFISPDGQRIYFYSDRDDAADLDLWLAVREPETGRFSAPAALAELNTRAYDLLPWVTPDELMIAFVSTRPTRIGSSDIWYAARASRDVPFEAPAPVVELNSDADEGRVALGADGLTVFFSSDRDGSPDLFTASRTDRGQPFSSPVSIEILNSTATDHDVALSADGRELFFASTRDGASAIWRALRACA